MSNELKNEFNDLLDEIISLSQEYITDLERNSMQDAYETGVSLIKVKKEFTEKFAPKENKND